MAELLASKFCDSLGLSVILCRNAENEPFRCLSSHLCGGRGCDHRTEDPRSPRHADLHG